MKWFRWYRETSSNPKLAMVAELADRPSECGEGSRVRGAVSLTDVIAVWAVMLEDAADDDHWGVCKRPAKFIASMLRWHEEEVQTILDAMVEQEMISIEDGAKILNWHEYQYTSDSDKTGAERQRRYYNKHKRKTNGKLTKPNALASQPETDSETDSETEKKESKTAIAVPMIYAFEGTVIRLTFPDYQKWTTAFSHLNLMAELVARDAWLASDVATDADRKKWFISTAAHLANRNQKTQLDDKQKRHDEIFPPSIYGNLR